MSTYIAIRIFIDSAERAAIQQALDTGFVSGVTTNPTLLRRAGVRAAEVAMLAAQGGGATILATSLRDPNELVTLGGIGIGAATLPAALIPAWPRRTPQPRRPGCLVRMRRPCYRIPAVRGQLDWVDWVGNITT